MFNLKANFSAPFSMKVWHAVRNKINTGCSHESYFVSEDGVMENVLGHFITIGINLPDTKNVLTERAMEKLISRIQNFENNDEIHCAVLHGCGGNFCRGVVATDAAKVLSQNLMQTLHTLRKPIIAALDGYTVNFGLQLAIMCDMRVMDKSALAGFSDKAQKLEIPSFLYERLIWNVGPSRTMELMCGRQSWAATECLGMGLVNKITDPGCALGQSISLAQSIAFNSPLENIIEQKSKILSFFSRKV